MIYTKDNPKLVENVFKFKDRTNFTGVVKDKSHKVIYYLNGYFHREDGPAVEYPTGNKSWYLNGDCYSFDNEYTNESWIRFVKLQLFN